MVSDLSLLVLFFHIKEFSIIYVFIKNKIKFKSSPVLTDTVQYLIRAVRYWWVEQNKFRRSLVHVRYLIPTNIWAGMELEV